MVAMLTSRIAGFSWSNDQHIKLEQKIDRLRLHSDNS